MRRLIGWCGVLALLGAVGCESPGGGALFPGDPDAAGVDIVGGDAASADTADTATADADPSPDTTSPGPTTYPVVDPACLDGQYTETLPDPGASVAHLVDGYSPAASQAFVAGVLEVRYPIGAHLVERGRAESSFGDCVAMFTQGATQSADTMLQRLATVVHECGHFLDIARGTFSTDTYVFRPDLSLTCSDGDARERFGNTFARSRITQDEYDSLKPDDFYKQVYLVGAGSDQGFNMLMEEVVQYINSLATDFAFADRLSPFMSISSRDGILTFLWYTQRYLRLARLTDPEVHDFLLGDGCWRETILTAWGRAWVYLDVTAENGSLGIDDDVLEALVLDQDLLGEIHRVREAHGCP